MTADEMLTALKIDLKMTPTGTAYDDLLNPLLVSAADYITREGATLNTNGSYEDAMLVVGYAAFLFRQRDSGDTELPRWLRYALNNRILSETAGDTDAG